MPQRIAQVTTDLVQALSNLETAEERRRAVQAALAILGDSLAPPAQPPTPTQQENIGSSTKTAIHPKAEQWMNRYNVSMRALEKVIHIDDDDVTLLCAIGGNKRQQTINTYILTGLCAQLSKGTPDFQDQVARDNCIRLGCYDSAHHAGTLKKFNNKISGNKNAGWKLTTPGLEEAALLISAYSQ